MKKFEQLSYCERQKIYRGLCEGKIPSEIAKELERPLPTITREIARNSDHIGYLYPDVAHAMAKKRKNINMPKVDKFPKLKKYIIQQLNKQLSPKMIAGSWTLDNPDQAITPEAIYQWIYGPDGESLGLKRLLLRSRKKRGLRRKKSASNIKDRVSVHDRPAIINERVETGHFEGDLMFNSGSQSKNVFTLAERVSRFAIVIKNENKRSGAIIDALIRYIKIHDLQIKSITFDNGSEFADHIKLNALGIATYFFDPGALWQKGSIENLNGVLRRYLPFNMPADDISDELINDINVRVNDLPREILGFKTSRQVFMGSRMKAALPAVEAFYNVSM